MKRFVSLSSDEMYHNREYIELVQLDNEIKEEERSQTEWTPGMIFASEDSLKYPRRLRNLLKRRLGLENVTGPFFSDCYFDNKVKITELPK